MEIRALKCSLVSVLEDLNYADESMVAMYQAQGHQREDGYSQRIAPQIGLTLNTTKTKMTRSNCKKNIPIKIFNGDALEKVQEFTCLGSLISTRQNTPSKRLEYERQAKHSVC